MKSPKGRKFDFTRMGDMELKVWNDKCSLQVKHESQGLKIVSVFPAT